jgi:nicotinamide phosphoribosyltransferase
MRTVIARKEDLEHSNVTDTDSYKFSHFILYKKAGVTRMFSYLESRGGEFDVSTISALQVALHRYIAKGFKRKDIDRAEKLAAKHGVPFNRPGFEAMYNKYNGKFPVRIRSIPEGMIVPVSTALLTIECCDEDCFWIVNWLETLLSRIWYPSTIAIASRSVKKLWKHFLDMTSDNTDLEIGFKHHDFGSRGVTCFEQAELGGMAHLLSFFGSDTLAGVELANYYYDCDMSGFSICATEHSTMTIFGRAGERQALIDWITETLVNVPNIPGVPKVSACVGDSYNIYDFTTLVSRDDEVRNLIANSGGTLVVRPDSGKPSEVLPKILELFEQNLPSGSITVNSKGYKVLPSYLRLIWGDGINRRSMKDILQLVVDLGWSASNIALGSGGGLLQDVNRDTQKFAFKCSFAEAKGVSIDVLKDPITDPGKKSKAGRLDTIKLPDGEIKTVSIGVNEECHPLSIMNTVFEMGDITYHTTFAECRDRMAL